MEVQGGWRSPSQHPLYARAGSPFRDEITLAILQLQENNRLEILKRKWWEGGRCPKEEDHRAKGQCPSGIPISIPTCPPPTLAFVPACRSGHGEHRWHLRGAHMRPHHCRICGRDGICLVHEAVRRVRRGEGGLGGGRRALKEKGT